MSGVRGEVIKKKLLIALGVVLAVLLLGPFLVPVPPLTDTLPVQQLADDDSLFMDFRGFAVHYKQWGEGEQVLVLLHGFGASVFSWRDAAPLLAQDYRVIAYDRPGFGLTERPLKWQGINPYGMEAQKELLWALLTELEVEQAILVGHSAGGAVAVSAALERPEQVEALVLVAPALSGGGRGWLGRIASLPQINRLGPLLVRNIARDGPEAVRSAWHDQSTFSDEILEGYTRPLQADNWDRGLWEFVKASAPMDLLARLNEINIPTLVISGQYDTIVPLEASEAAAEGIAGAVLEVFAHCGHLPQEEYPGDFARAVREFLAGTSR